MWFSDNGNHTHAITYPLNDKSVVVDLGGFNGTWAKQIIEKYNPYMFLVEPIPDFYENLCAQFSNNPKVKVINAGVASSDGTALLYLSGDGTSKYINQHLPTIEVTMISIETLLKIIGKNVDLVQINIEGEEYNLLENMIQNDTVHMFSNIQIQFHPFVENFEERRENIHKHLAVKFDKLFDYPFVFEGWTIKK
jgi:FkbM family methyltransferase